MLVLFLGARRVNGALVLPACEPLNVILEVCRYIESGLSPGRANFRLFTPLNHIQTLVFNGLFDDMGCWEPISRISTHCF